MAQRNVLIVDHDAFQRQLVDMLLAVDNHKTVQLDSGSDVLAYVQNETPDLIIMASDLPDIPGTDVCAKIKHVKRLHDVPVILTSPPLKHEVVRDLGRAVKADLVLEKPLADKSLREHVEVLLAAVDKAVEEKNKETAELVMDSAEHNVVPDLSLEGLFEATTEAELELPLEAGKKADDTNHEAAPAEGAAPSVVRIEGGKRAPELDAEPITEDNLMAEMNEVFEKGLTPKVIESGTVTPKAPIRSTLAELGDDEDLRRASSKAAKTNLKPLVAHTEKSEKLKLLEHQVEDLLDENERLKAAIGEFEKTDKSIISTDSYLDAIEELEALRRLNEHQTEQLNKLHKENQSMRQHLDMTRLVAKRKVWERLKL